ncbi:MAG: M20/M25/M40 family metallo-hydrolase [Candidatus Absconditabacterales bacterium]
MLAEYYQLLKEFVSFKSISADQNFSDEIKKTAERLKKLFETNGFQSKIFPGYGNPILFATYNLNKSLPTCLIYGHYDVHFADKKEGRKKDPFSLHIGKDKVFGRGVVDNKGQILIHLLNIFHLIKDGKLGYNIIFLIQGDKESGSLGLEKFIVDHKDKLKSDFSLISDSMIFEDNPCIDIGFRGSLNVTLKVSTCKSDFHSGFYGSVLPNAIQELSKLISKLHEMNNNIAIPYFYYDVDNIPINFYIKNKKIKVDYQQLEKKLGVKSIFKTKDFDFLIKVGLSPSLQITGIFGGGETNIIPGIASVNLNFRTVKSQNNEKIINSFKQRIKFNIPEYVDYEIKIGENFDPCKLNIDNQYVQKADSILKTVYGKSVIYKYSGGSIPILNLFEKYLGSKTVLIPLANEDSNPHGTNENFDVNLIEKGLLFSYQYFKNNLIL